MICVFVWYGKVLAREALLCVSVFVFYLLDPRIHTRLGGRQISRRWRAAGFDSLFARYGEVINTFLYQFSQVRGRKMLAPKPAWMRHLR